jgi:hypothetical protein
MKYSLVRNHEARSVIVLGEFGDDAHFAAREMQRYIRSMTGVSVPIQSEPAGTDESIESVIVVGEHAPSLSADGFEIRTKDEGGRRTVSLGGGSASGLMYACYDFLERLGVVFRISDDIVPFVGPDLECPKIDLRREPAFARRGLNYWGNHHASSGTWSLDDFRRWIDQMAKLKFNHLLWHWFDWDAGLDYEFRGERKLIGDLSPAESGYTFRRSIVGSYSTKEIEIGRERFIHDWFAPLEFQDCPQPDDAFRIMGDKLRAIQARAKSRHIEMTLGFEPLVFAPNIGRLLKRLEPLPYQTLMGTYVCPSDPATIEANEARLRALFERYPDTSSICLWMSEGAIPCKCASCQEIYERYLPEFAGAEESFERYEVTNPDTLRFDIAFLDLLLKLRVILRRIRPEATLMIANIGREYIFPYFDKLVPNDVTFASLTSRGFAARDGISMDLFQSEAGRPMWAIGRLDDDGSMIGLQFNVELIRKDGFFAEGRKYGVGGQVFQFTRSRGSEHNCQYQAECSWDPELTPEAFYKRYLSRVFGAEAMPLVHSAYRHLEKNEELLGYDGRYILPSYGYGWELKILQLFRDELNPFEGPKFVRQLAGHVSWYWGQSAMLPYPPDDESTTARLERMINGVTSKQEYWDGFMKRCKENLEIFPEGMRLLSEAEGCFTAASQIVPGAARDELRYLINKTRAYIAAMEAILTMDRAYLTYARAFEEREEAGHEGFVAILAEAEQLARQAKGMAQESTRITAKEAEAPEDLGCLFSMNKRFADGYGQVELFMMNVLNFHRGRPYWAQIDWEGLFPRMIG